MDFKSILKAESEGKAFGPHRFFADNSPVATYIPGGDKQRQRGLLSQREASHHLQSFGGGEAIDWVMGAVGLYSDTAASAPWHLEKDGEKVYLERTKLTPDNASLASPDLVRLLKKPNPMMDWAELLDLLVIDFMLVGNAYWLKWQQTAEGKPLALWRLSPSYVKIRPLADGSGIDKYVYQPPGVSEPTEFSPRDLLHFKRPNPHNPYYGLGVIKGGGRPLDLELALTDATANYFENKADPSLIVQSERRVPRDVFNKLRAQLRARVSGTSNAGELLVLEAGLKASTLSPNARDAMYMEMAQMSRDRVLAMFRVHPRLLGMPGTTGDDKVQDIRREFDNKALRPFLTKLQDRITEGLVSVWGYDFKIDYRYIMPAEEAIKLSGDLGSVPGIKVADVRGFLVEAGIITDISTGDQAIDDMVLNLPGEELDEDGSGGFADRNLPREAGRPPKGENTKPFPKAGQKLPAKSAARRPGKALGFDDIVKALDSVRVTVGNHLPDEKLPDGLEKQRTTDIDFLAANMQADLAKAATPLERALMDHAEGKAVFDPKTLKKRLRESPAWKTFQEMLEATMVDYIQQAVSTAVVHHGGLGLISDEELDYESIARGLVHRPEGLRSIVSTLRRQILSKTDALPTRQEVLNAIREEIRNWNVEMIALTEIVSAYNEGTLVVAEAAGVEQVYVSDGDDHDQPCIDANGQIWDIATARANRLEHPNCRRAFVPLSASI